MVLEPLESLAPPVPSGVFTPSELFEPNSAMDTLVSLQSSSSSRGVEFVGVEFVEVGSELHAGPSAAAAVRLEALESLLLLRLAVLRWEALRLSASL